MQAGPRGGRRSGRRSRNGFVSWRGNGRGAWSAARCESPPSRHSIRAATSLQIDVRHAAKKSAILAWRAIFGPPSRTLCYIRCDAKNAGRIGARRATLDRADRTAGRGARRPCDRDRRRRNDHRRRAGRRAARSPSCDSRDGPAGSRRHARLRQLAYARRDDAAARPRRRPAADAMADDARLAGRTRAAVGRVRRGRHAGSPASRC